MSNKPVQLKQEAFKRELKLKKKKLQYLLTNYFKRNI